MLVLKCSACGHGLEVGNATLDRGVNCPRCGATVQLPAPAAPGANDAATRVIGDSPLTPPPRPADPTEHGSATGDTPTYPSRQSWQTYAFLAAAKNPNELGNLAHYRVLKVLGEGGMGIVFEAIDTNLERTIALKVMKPDMARDDAARQRFLREARATAKVKSDFIVTIHQVGEAQDVPFLAMEFLEGEPLDRWLQRNPRPSVADTVRLGMEMARGLASAHESGLIHRDIKPANIWLESPSGRVKILDFGLARQNKDQSTLTNTGVIMGTPAYMAPEQAEGTAIDARCDLFSLGCVLYEMATGERPFAGATTMAVLMAVVNKDTKPIEQFNADVPPALADLIHRLLAKRPADRPASARRVAEELAAIADEMGVAPSSAQSGGRGSSKHRTAAYSRQKRRHWPVYAGMGAVVMSVVAGAAFWLLGPRPVAAEIEVGISAPFSGPVKELGQQMAIGIKTYFSALNDQGGVGGSKLALTSLNDGYEPDAALKNMQEFHDQRKVFAVLGNVGTPTAEKTVPYANQNKMLFFGAFTGAPLLRKDPPDRYVFNYRASYEEETAAIVKYLLEIRKIQPDQIAVFAQNDGYGEAGFKGVAKRLRPWIRDAKDILLVHHERNKTDVRQAVEEIKKHKDLRAVVMVTTYKPAAAFIQKLKDAGRDLIFTNVSFVGSDALAEEFRDSAASYGEGVIVTQVVPFIYSESTAVAKYRQMLQKYYPSERPSFVSLEGYISAALFAEGLKKAGEKPTTESVIDALETIHQLDLGLGTALTFGPSEHQASHKVWGTILDKAANYQVLELE